jgi:predicted lipid-binding transport protein (Tim44 family)
MRKLASFVTIFIAVAVFAGLYFATPYVMHAQSHTAQFLAVLAAGLAVGFGVVLLIAGVVMRGNALPTAPPPKRPPAPSVPVPSPALEHMVTARKSLEAARERRKANPTTSDLAGEVWQVELAVESLLLMVEDARRVNEGRR